MQPKMLGIFFLFLSFNVLKYFWQFRFDHQASPTLHSSKFCNQVVALGSATLVQFQIGPPGGTTVAQFQIWPPSGTTVAQFQIWPPGCATAAYFQIWQPVGATVAYFQIWPPGCGAYFTIQPTMLNSQLLAPFRGKTRLPHCPGAGSSHSETILTLPIHLEQQIHSLVSSLLFHARALP